MSAELVKKLVACLETANDAQNCFGHDDLSPYPKLEEAIVQIRACLHLAIDELNNQGQAVSRESLPPEYVENDSPF